MTDSHRQTTTTVSTAVRASEVKASMHHPDPGFATLNSGSAIARHTYACLLKLPYQQSMHKRKKHSHNIKVYLCILFVLSCSKVSPSEQCRCNHQGGQTHVCKHAAFNMTYYRNYMTNFSPLIMQVRSCSSETLIHQEKKQTPQIARGDCSACVAVRRYF